jgi:hypothetical protein
MIFTLLRKAARRRGQRPPKAFTTDDRGGVAVLAAVTFPVVVGGLGLWVEAGYWYLKQRHAQHIADVAAYSAGARLRAGDGVAAIQLVARHVAVASGLDLSNATLVVNTPPTSGQMAGNANALEVLVSTRHQRWFSAIYASGDVDLHGRAVIRIEGGRIACMLALSATAPRAISITGSSSLNLENCDVASNSNAADGLYQTSSLTANCGYSVGGVVSTGALTLSGCDALRANASIARDPYADVPQPENFGPCAPNNIGHPTTVTTVVPVDPHPSGIPSIRFCGGLNFKGSLDLRPGIYILDGGETQFTGGTVGSASTPRITGTGVTFVLLNSQMSFTGNVQLQLSAPESGALSGILFFGSRSSANTMSHTLNGAVGTFLNGAVYLPRANVTYSGRSQTVNGCTQIIANTITLTGASQLEANCDQAGTRPLYSTEVVRLIE